MVFGMEFFLYREKEEEEEEEEAAPSSNLLSAFEVHKTVEIPLLQFINVVVFFCCGAEACLHGWDSPVAVHLVVDVPVVRARRLFRLWHVQGWFAGFVVHRSVFPLLSASRRRQRWQYMAGFAGDEAPYAVFSIFVVRSARHHGRYGREGQLRGASLSWCRGRFPWSALRKSRCPCCSGRAGSLVSGSHLHGVRCSPVEYRILDFSGRSQESSVFNSPWFDSVYDAFWTNVSCAIREGGLRIDSTRVVG